MTRRSLFHRLAALAASPAALLAALPARAQRGPWPNWRVFKDRAGDDLGIDFRHAVEKFNVPPNRVWYQFRSRRTKPVRFTYYLTVFTESSQRQYIVETSLNADSKTAEAYYPGDGVKTVDVKVREGHLRG